MPAMKAVGGMSRDRNKYRLRFSVQAKKSANKGKPANNRKLTQRSNRSGIKTDPRIRSMDISRNA